MSNPPLNKMGASRTNLPSSGNLQLNNQAQHYYSQILPPMHNHHQGGGGDFPAGSQNQHPGYNMASMAPQDYVQQRLQSARHSKDRQYPQHNSQNQSGVLSPQNGGQQQVAPQMAPA